MTWGAGALVALVALAGFPGTSEGLPITYTVTRTITDNAGTNVDGSVGTVTGTITTDGTIGSLLTGNVTSWSLDLNDGVFATTFHIDPTNSAFQTQGANLVASATQLSFNFGAFGDALFDNPNIAGSIYWGLEGTAGGLIGAGDGLETVRTVVSPGLWTSVNWGSTTQVVGEVAAVPEPASLLLFGTGLAVAGVRRWRKSR